ncbi:CDP-diacylglycerol--serine O-phosphatidyltransferase [Zooshikella sp. RANM57]|uniref:CDP-diacylglycerol--serine O-phosphatidyltransferase n=1 Tax=Zooshikella sp. RANM57 TaxID=3425863 RepID=UPI003D6DF07B
MNEEKHSVTNNDEQVEQIGESILPIDEHVEEVAENGRKVRRRGVYLLPNLFTTAALFSGFYSAVAAMQFKFEHAAIAIFVAMILDGLDGRVARLTNTQSAFGAEYDSLSDMIAFGFAPAILCYSWTLHSLGKAGWMVAFIYVACTALRLARFNTQISSADKRYFTGLPCPSAAAVVTGMTWVCTDFGFYPAEPGISILAALITAGVGILMVSNVRYHSFKDLDIKGRVPFVMIFALVLIFAVVSIDPPRTLLSVFMLYATSGPALALWRLWKRSKTTS